LRCGGERVWRNENLNKRYRNIDTEISIRIIVGCNNKDQWQETGIHIIKCKEKWEMVRKNEGKVEINLHV
jgi:hypothetical protein